MDVMVYETQKWLNNNYTGKPGYITLDLSDAGGIKGRTGWTTIYALTRAFQIELGITETAPNFGPTTRQRFQERFKNGIQQQDDNATSEDNIYGIIQGALWCKGYSTGASSITKQFKSGTGQAVYLLKKEAGLSDTSTTVTLNVMESLLSMKQFRLVSGGDLDIQAVQRKINANYEPYTGIIPCDGIYAREMNKALIQVLQSIENLSPADATGNFGEYTKTNCPVISSMPPSNLSQGKYEEAVRLIKFALTCNGFYPGDLTGTWDAALVMHLSLFQNEYGLPQAAVCDLNTWMALLLSSGNPDREAIACDTSAILDTTMAQALYRDGYRYIGRYLTGTVGLEVEVPKDLTESEAIRIFNAGLNIFAIFQTGSAYPGRYTYEKGERDAQEAIEAADVLGIPYGEIIYFAVDYDLLGEEIESNALPYFQGIQKIFLQHNGKYNVGIYGTRNTCNKISEAGYAISSFVSDMSTGFSGNMGFKIPNNWAFDQFAQIQYSYPGGRIDLDKNGYSGRYSGFSKLEKHPNPSMPPTIENDLKEEALILLRKLYSEIGAEFTLTQKYSEKITYGSISCEIEYGTAINTAMPGEFNIRLTEVEIHNGKISANVLEELTDIFLIAFSDDATAQLDKIMALANEISDGTIKIGFTILPNFFSIYYEINKECTFDNGLTCTLTTYFKLTQYSNDFPLLEKVKYYIESFNVPEFSNAPLVVRLFPSLLCLCFLGFVVLA